MHALATTLVLCLQASPLDDFYKFKPGTSWTYKRTEDGTERTITGVVADEKDGKVRLEWKDPGEGGTDTVTWRVEDKILIVESAKEGGGTELAFGVLKEGAKKDDTWTSYGATITHRGTTEVTVPAGTYKEAVWTHLKLKEDGDEVTVDFYLVPKVGLVKVDIKTKKGGKNRFELTEFKEAGK